MAPAWQPNKLSITDRINAVQTATIGIEDRYGALWYQEHDPIVIDAGLITLFRGDVDEVELVSAESPYAGVPAGGGTPVGARFWNVTATGLSKLAFRILTGSFSAEARVPISLVVTTLAGMLGVDVSVDASIALPDSFMSEQEYVGDALTRLAEIATAQTGTLYIWKIGWPGTSFSTVTLVFQPVTNLICASSIGLGGYAAKSGSIQYRRMRGQFANSVTLKLDRYLKDGGSAVEETYDATDIFLGTLKVEFPFAGQPTITLEGDPQTVGIKDSDTDKDWYWALGSNVLTVGDTAAGGTDEIVVSYPAHDLRAVVAQDLSSIGSVGLFQHSAQSPDSGNVSSPSSEASAELTRRNGITERVTVTVKAPGGTFYAGQLIPVALAGFGLSGASALTGYFCCESVRTYDEQMTVLWHDLELFRGPMLFKGGKLLRRG